MICRVRDIHVILIYTYAICIYRCIHMYTHTHTYPRNVRFFATTFLEILQSRLWDLNVYYSLICGPTFWIFVHTHTRKLGGCVKWMSHVKHMIRPVTSVHDPHQSPHQKQMRQKDMRGKKYMRNDVTHHISVCVRIKCRRTRSAPLSFRSNSAKKFSLLAQICLPLVSRLLCRNWPST